MKVDFCLYYMLIIELTMASISHLLTLGARLRARWSLSGIKLVAKRREHAKFQTVPKHFTESPLAKVQVTCPTSCGIMKCSLSV